MLCKKCGAQLPDGTEECQYCGAQLEKKKKVTQPEIKEENNEIFDENELKRQEQIRRMQEEKQQQLSEIERRREEKRRKQRLNKIILICSICAAGVAAAGIGTYVVKNSMNNPGQVEITPAPTAAAVSPMPSALPSTSPAAVSPSPENNWSATENNETSGTASSSETSSSSGSSSSGTSSGGNASSQSSGSGSGSSSNSSSGSGSTSWRSPSGSRNWNSSSSGGSSSGSSSGSSGTGNSSSSGSSSSGTSPGGNTSSQSGGSGSSSSGTNANMGSVSEINSATNAGVTTFNINSSLVTGGEVIYIKDADKYLMTFIANGKRYYANVSPGSTTAQIQGKKLTITAVPTNARYDGNTVYEITSITYYDGDDYIISESGTKALTQSDLSGLSKKQLTLARNEIYARHGRKFQTAEFQSYFESKSWYRINPNYNYQDDNANLNEIEEKNVAFILNAESNM